jgi:alpha-tubulin suppressor-like RCC1 family protein
MTAHAGAYPATLTTETTNVLTGVVAGDMFSFIKTTGGRILSLGNNTFGTLGNGFFSTVPFPSPMEVMLSGQKTFAIASGGSFSVLVTDACNYTINTTTVNRTGSILCPGSPPKLYGVGSNNVGQLGGSTGNITYTYVPVPVDMTGPINGQHVVEVKSGLGYTIAVTSTGKLFGWGNNTAGTLGDNSVTNRFAPVALYDTYPSALNQKFINTIACGSTWCHALSSTNDLIYWGSLCRSKCFQFKLTNQPLVPLI